MRETSQIPAETSFAEGCADREWIADRLFHLFNDNYGVRDTLFDFSTKFWPVETTNKLVDALWARFQLEPNSAYRWSMAIESLARQLNDSELFEKARRVTDPSLSPKSMVDIARVCLDSGDAKTALDWLGKVPESARSRVFDYDTLSLEIFKKLKDKKVQAEVAWRVFRDHRSTDTLDTLLAAIARSRKEEVIVSRTFGLNSEGSPFTSVSPWR